MLKLRFISPPVLTGAILFLTSALVVRAELISLFPSQDATLIGRNPTNSLGGAGWFTAGVTQNGDTNHALIQFDIPSAVPAGSRIVGVQLRLVVTRVPGDGQTDSEFTLRRLFRPWGEGVNNPSFSPGFGVPALLGDATWTHRFFGTTNTWAIPGGAEGIDYSATVSGVAYIGGFSSEPYLFDTTSQMVADVQNWLAYPGTNHGWLIKTEAGNARFTARGFGSRELEDPATSAQLLIDYALPPLLSIARTGNTVQFSFPAAPGGTYQIESCPALGSTNAWTTLTNLGYQFFYNTLTAHDAITAPSRFYRVRID